MGPARVADEPPAPKQAIYDGTVSGDRMQLRLSINGESLGCYALQRGADPQMVNCLRRHRTCTPAWCGVVRGSRARVPTFDGGRVDSV